MTEGVTATAGSASVNTELAMRRTGMAFQRTRMAADRTLMAVIRTSLSLISFGFTIYQFFNKLKEAGVLKGVAPSRNFGTSLVWLGIIMLMAVIRTSLSLISFGFTIYTFFNKLRDAGVLKGVASSRNFGTSLVWLGIIMLILGISYHILFMLGLRDQRAQLKIAGLVHGQSKFPASLVLITALALLLIGFFAVASMGLHIGPFE